MDTVVKSPFSLVSRPQPAFGPYRRLRPRTPEDGAVPLYREHDGTSFRRQHWQSQWHPISARSSAPPTAPAASSISLRAEARASGSLAASLPPAWARSGRPPPPPPTSRAADGDPLHRVDPLGHQVPAHARHQQHLAALLPRTQEHGRRRDLAAELIDQVAEQLRRGLRALRRSPPGRRPPRPLRPDSCSTVGPPDFGAAAAFFFSSRTSLTSDSTRAGTSSGDIFKSDEVLASAALDAVDVLQGGRAGQRP